MNFTARLVTGIVLAVAALGMGGVSAWNATMEQRAVSAGAEAQPQGGVGTTAPGIGAAIAAVLGIAAQFWTPTDPKQVAIKRKIDAVATLLADGMLDQAATMWAELRKNGVPDAIDARIQWGSETPYNLKWGKIVENIPPAT